MKIAHLADIQIRAHSRHEEYAKSFEHLFASLLMHKPDSILLAGDIVHNKTVMTPELVDLCRSFFQGLVNIAPLDIVHGNHDLAMNNLGKLDALSPIVKAINNPYIRLLTQDNSTVAPLPLHVKDPYSSHSCVFADYVVMDLRDTPERWKEIKQASLWRTQSKVKIGVWHGTVNGVLLGNGEKLESPHDLSMFDGLDYVMLGDIHEHQVLDKQRRIAYPGSYPQQSYGESTRKGYLLWDIKSKDEHTLEFIDLPLVHPFYTIDAHEVCGIDLQKNARIRVLCNGLSKAEQDDLAKQVRQKHEALEVRIVDETPKVAKVADKLEVESLRSLPTQERMMNEYAAGRGLSAGQQTKLSVLNAEASNALQNDDVLRNARYKIESVKFSNLFSFGHDNVLDFSKLKGVIGVQGKNRSGKSSLVVDVPMLGFFNKISKPVASNAKYVNATQTDADVELNIKLDGKSYRIHRCIERRTVHKRNGLVQTQSTTGVDFECGEDSLNALDRADTDKQIRKVFGTADDFMRTTVAAQFDLLGFIHDKAADRKATLGRYFDLEFFAEKLAYASKRRSALDAEVRRLGQRDHKSLITDAEKALEAHVNAQKNLAQCESEMQRAYESACEHCSSLAAPKPSPFKDEAFKLKTQYQAQQQRVRRLQQDISDLASYECTTYEKCCMRQRSHVLQEQFRQAQDELSHFYDEMHDLVSRQKAFQETQDADAGQALRQAQAKRDEAHRQLASVRQHLRSEAKNEGAQHSYIEQLRREHDRLKEAQDEQAVVSLFCEAMSKDGIPAQIIKRNISVINGAIAALLQNNTAFTIWLEYTDKEIVIWFQEHQGIQREIEICSGMEKTMAAIAIRAALISITSLPVSNIFILDEAFTALDAEHFEAMGKMLESLKSTFDTVLLICHDEYIKDLCDDMIVVARDEQGTSRIHY